MKSYNIPFHKPTLLGEEGQMVQNALEVGNWSKISEESKLFFSNYFAGSTSFFTNSCSSALEIAVKALNISAGDEIIIPGFSYVALANAVVNSGATPVYADVSMPACNIDLQSVKACISPRTKAIIALHYAGNACDICGLLDLCNSNGIILIEDAAQCIGSTFNDKYLGCFGHIGCISFDYMKNITCGQGGLLVVNDRRFLSAVQTIYDNGTDKFALVNGTQNFFEWVSAGNNYQINSIGSYFLWAQLKSITAITKRRLEKWSLYQQLLKPLADKDYVCLNNPVGQHNGHIFFLITNLNDERDRLQNHLKKSGIVSEHHYSSLAQSPFGKQFANTAKPLKNSETLSGRLLRLPLWDSITQGQVEIVASCILSFYGL